MGNFKYKLKEQRQILKPGDVDSPLIKRLEAEYGLLDMEHDFFSNDLKTKIGCMKCLEVMSNIKFEGETIFILK